MTRAQISEVTLKRLWGRERLTAEFLTDVQEWLLTAGWALFYAGPIYGAVKIAALRNWPSVAAKRIGTELDQVALGQYEFDQLEPLLTAPDSGTGTEADEN